MLVKKEHATVCLAEDIGEAEDVELVELDVVAAFLGSDAFDENDSSHGAFLAEAAQAEATASFATQCLQIAVEWLRQGSSLRQLHA